MRLLKIKRGRILYSALTADQELSHENSKCWGFFTLNKVINFLNLIKKKDK